jgi:multidrug efflux pump
MLVGLVTKNGILIVEFANEQRLTGKNKYEAAVESAALRLRPILMTTLVAAFGALPLALALGAASKSRMPLGIVIVGGLLFSLVLTLYVVPVIYTYMTRRKDVDHRPLPQPDGRPTGDTTEPKEMEVQLK